MKTAICSKCFTQSSEDQWLYTCRRDNCASKGNTIKQSETVSGRGGAPSCSGCGEPFASPLCPSCGFSIYETEPGATSISISIVGAQGCGKSHFLSVLIEQLKQEISKAYDCALFPLGGDDTISLYDRLYYQPLFVRGQVLESTEQDDVNPLIYSMVFQQERGPKTLDLIFYDACGANFESIAAMSSFNRSIYHSGGIIFLIDPSQFPVVGEWNATHHKEICESDPTSLLSRTVQLIRTGSGQKSLRQKLDVPIAVCLTKLDSVKPLLDVSSFLQAPSRHISNASFDALDFEACSLEAQSLIESWGGGEITRQVSSQFSERGFFAISSLGGSPSDSGGIHHIAPHRVSDPLLWLLWKNKIIK